jgi:hypothetical protein
MSLLNTFHSDSFKVVFSNIPQVSIDSEKIKMGVLNNYVKAVTLPDYTLEVVKSDFMDMSRLNPSSRYNNEFSQLTIEFKLDEDMENYFYLHKWINELRKGNATKNDTLLHESNIKSIQIILKDNQKRNRKIITFKECCLLSLGSLPLEFGSSQEILFTCTFDYYDFSIEKADVVANN